jgi:O-antigen/teichoic acid export membrane protein
MIEKEKTANPPAGVGSESVKFARDVIWVGISQILGSLIGIVILSALTKSYSPDTYGIWAQVTVTVSLISPILTLQLGSAVVRFLAGEEEAAVRRRSLGAMLGTILIFACSILIIANLLAPQLSLFLFDNSTHITFVRLTSLWIFFDALLVFLISYLRARGKIKRISFIQIGFALSKMVFILAFSLAGLALTWIIASNIFIEFSVIAYILYLIIAEEGLPQFDFSRIREFLAFSLPQVPSSAFLWIISASDRYFITHFLDLSRTGIYSSSAGLAGVISMFYAPIGFVLFPAVSKAWEENRQTDVKKYFEYSIKLFLTLAIPAAAGLTILSQPLLSVLTTSEYLAGWKLLLLIAIGMLFLGTYQINAYIMYLVKQTKWLPLMIAVASAVSIGLNYALIPSIGIIGAAIANMVSYIILAAIVTFWARKIFSFSVDLVYLSKIVAGTLVMALCLYFLKLDGVWGIVLSIIAGLVVYAIALLLLKAFSPQDRQLLKQTLGGIFPRLSRRSS